jgi:hypothetical protein
MRFLFLFSVFVFSAIGQISPFGFEPNLGQYPPNVRFVRRGSSNFFYFTRDAMVLQNRIRLQIADVDPNVSPAGDSPTSTVYNFYQGNTPSKWRANVRMFGAVRLANIYPGVNALFTSSTPKVTPTFSIGEGKLILTIRPGADLDRFRLRVLNTGTVPSEGPGGIWFAGGNVPGVFIVSVKTTQLDGNQQVPIVSNLKIESSEVLSVQAPGRNPDLTTEVEITFPDYDFANDSMPRTNTPGGDRYLASYASIPVTLAKTEASVRRIVTAVAPTQHLRASMRAGKQSG